MKQPNKTPQILKLIVSRRSIQRIQIDFVDFRTKAGGKYKWLLQIKDHFSRFVWLQALKQKEAVQVAERMAIWYGESRYPIIL